MATEAGEPTPPPPLQQSAGSALSFWAYKPRWCQPWSIISTGALLVAGSWLLLHRWWISLPLGLAVVAWWGLFLVLVPAAWRAEQQAAAVSSQR